MNSNPITIFGVDGIGEIQQGVRLGAIIGEAAQLADGDVVVVAQKLVSKSEGQIVAIDTTSALAKRAIVLGQAVAVLRDTPDVIITQTAHGFVCANSGVDLSNAPSGFAVLLPKDCDKSAHRIRTQIRATSHVDVGVIISDTFGRAWRYGTTDVALGVAGLKPIVDLRGHADAAGRTMSATEICVADEIAGAAELIRRQADGIGVVVVRGVSKTWFGEGSIAGEVVRPASQDLFR